jgi:hypothetical protein
MAIALFIENPGCSNIRIRSYNNMRFEIVEESDMQLLPLEEYGKGSLGSLATRYNGWKLFQRHHSFPLPEGVDEVYLFDGIVLPANPSKWTA